VLVELGLQGLLRLRDGLRGEVDPTGAIRASTNLPIHLQSRDSAKRAQDLVEKIGAGFLGESRVDREKDIIHRVALVSGDNPERNEGFRRVCLGVFPEGGTEVLTRRSGLSGGTPGELANNELDT